MVYMLFLATLFHGVLILGITFSDEIPSFSVRPLEVVLVGPGESTEAPERARYVAERSQRGEGGGPDGETVIAGSLSTGAPIDNAGTPDGRALEPPPPDPGSEAAEAIASRGPAERRVQSVKDAGERPDDPQIQARLMHAAQESAVLAPDAGKTHIDGPRERTVAVDTQEAMFAGYLAAWKQRVEQLGTINFPDAARRAGLAGSPVLEVAIGADGGLREIIVVRSSKEKLLDQAALRILRLAAPFEPFPEAMRRQYDVLRFVYEWRFIGPQPVAQN
jgi:protein TonB